MYGLLKDGIVVSKSSEIQTSDGLETVKINSDVVVGNELKNYKVIEKTIVEFSGEADIENKKLKTAYEKAVTANEKLDEDKQKVIKEPTYENSYENFIEYIATFSDDDFEVIETDYQKEKAIEDKITEINNQFDKDVSNYLSKYPKREQDTFAQKLSEAEKVIGGGSSVYITMKAEALGVSESIFAGVIIAKNAEWVKLYTELENEKDLAIASLTT